MRLREGWRGKQHTNKNRCGRNRYPKSSRHEHLISLPFGSRQTRWVYPLQRLEREQLWRPNLVSLKTSRLDRRNFEGRRCPRRVKTDVRIADAAYWSRTSRSLVESCSSVNGLPNRLTPASSTPPCTTALAV